jgi:hypothetical protein
MKTLQASCPFSSRSVPTSDQNPLAPCSRPSSAAAKSSPDNSSRLHLNLKLALAVYPEAWVDLQHDGLVLFASLPAVPPASPSRVKLVPDDRQVS